MVSLSRSRVYAKSAVTSANLRGIGYGLQIYVQDCGAYPDSLRELVAKGLLAWDQVQSVCDPDVRYDVPADEAEYSSFVYQAGGGAWRADPRLILAYERGPWTPVELRLLPEHGRCVLFGDGRVERLDDEAFETAKRGDATARRELGWPTQSDALESPAP
jgi:hypothetical protein